jgi:hypothetical protein
MRNDRNDVEFRPVRSTANRGVPFCATSLKDPIDFDLEDVVLRGTPEEVVDRIRALEMDAGMTYLTAAPLSRRSFTLLTDKVLRRIAV